MPESNKDERKNKPVKPKASSKKSAKKKVASKKSTVKKTTNKKLAKKKAAPKSAPRKKTTRQPTAKKRSSTQSISHKDRYEMIAKMAYFRAEKRGFEPGWEQQDWLESEKLIDEMLRKMND